MLLSSYKLMRLYYRQVAMRSQMVPLGTLCGKYFEIWGSETMHYMLTVILARWYWGTLL